MTGFRVEVAWDKVNYTDETTRLRASGGISAQYGRDQSTALAPAISGSGQLTLDNADRRFSPRNTASPLYGYLKPARPVRIYRDTTAGTTIVLVGHTDDTPINPDIDARTVSLSLVDSLADFRGQTIHTPLYSGVRTGQAIGYVLDACGWPTDRRDLDPGATVCPWWWEDSTDALTALDKLVQSEGPPALLTVGSDGEIVFRDRHHRLLRAASLASQQTWRGTGYGLVMNKPFVYDEAWRNIINSGVASVDVRAPGLVEPVWTSDTTITLSAGQQKLVTASSSDPFYGAVNPVAGTDYAAVSGTVTTALLRTSGGSAAILLTAVGGAAVISGLQLRAHPVPVAYTVQVSESDPDSKEEYGTRSFPTELPWCGVGDAEAVLSTAVALRSHPLPIVQARFMVGRDTAKAAVLTRDLGDRVHIVEPETVTDSDFYIESIQHDLTGEHDHAVVFGLESAPEQIDNVFRLGTAGQGLNAGRLGRGFDDPGNILIVGSTAVGHRLGEGVTAA